MFKKLFIGLTPLLAIAAFAVMPVAAQKDREEPARRNDPVLWLV